MHDAGCIRAMPQIKGVSEFMDSFLEHSGLKLLAKGFRVQALLKAIGGNDPGSPSELGFAVNMGQDGDEQIVGGEA